MNELRLYLAKLFLIACALLTIASCNEKKQFNGFLYPIRENGLYGFIDSVGNRIMEPEYLWVSTFHNDLAMAVVDTIYREVPDSMAYEKGEMNTILTQYRMYARYGYIDKSGKYIIEPKFVCYVDMPEIGYVVKDMSACNNVFYRFTYNSNRAVFYDTLTWKSGYIDTKGTVTIEPIYYNAEIFNNGRAVVGKLEGNPVFINDMCLNPSKIRYAYIDTTGTAKTEFIYENLSIFNSNRGVGSYYEIFVDSLPKGSYTNHIYIINEDGKEIKPLSFFNQYYGYGRDGICIARQVMHLKVFDGMPDSYSFIDANGVFLEPLLGLSESQIDSLNRCDDIMGVLNDDATIVSTTFFSNGFAGISLDGRHWLVIDKYLIVHGYGDESVFENFKGFYNGLAAVKRNGKWGFIDKRIKEVIPCKYDSCGGAYPYLEEVFEYDIQGEVKKKAYINRNDSLVWESPTYNSEKIENRYSIKESKDYGKWTYEYNPLNKQLICLIIGVVLVLIIPVFFILKSVSPKSSKGENLEELVIKNESENDEVTDANLSNVNDDNIDEILSYPTVGQYTEAIKDSAKAPDEYFDKLKHLRPVFDDNGEPIMSSGNFAVVFKMKDEYGKQYAVRCFHRAQQGRERNYKLICEELAKVSSPYLSPIRYYYKELFVDSDEYPVLLMDWVDGLPLDKYIRKVLNEREKLVKLANEFRKLSVWLLSQPFAHGDLKPDNILVKNDGSLVLVDYDGMYVPAMQGQKARELGSPDFRDPSRTEDSFNKDIDDLPILSILLSLEMLVENKEYLSMYGAEDRLLFSKNDYEDFQNCELYKIAYSSYNDDISELASEIRDILNNKEDAEKLASLIMRKDIRNAEKKGNEKLEKRIEILILLYNLAIPISAYIYSRLVKTEDWDVFGISAGILGSVILLYIVISMVDAFRPYKSSHLYVDEDITSFGCLIGMFDLFIPLIGLFSPDYDGEWYITMLIIVMWVFFFNVDALLSAGEITYLTVFFKSKEERQNDFFKNEKEKIRSEIRIKQEQGKKAEVQKAKQNELLHEDLPF